MWDPVSIVFGVRHKKRFSFLDNAGDVLDSVIEMQEGGELPQGISFDQVGWEKTGSVLQDAKGAVTVNFAIDGIVLTVDLVRSRLNRENTKRAFLALARLVLPITGGDDRVDRIGTLENYKFDHRASGEAAMATLTNLGSLGTASDVAIRISFRSPTEHGLTQKDIGDWRNTIIQVWNRRGLETEADQSRLDVSIDFQTYFVPERQYGASLVDDHYRRFLERLETLQSTRLAGLAGEQVTR